MNWQPGASLEILKYRARICQQIRAFFDASGCLEVTTPLLSRSSNTDVHIESVIAEESGRQYYLQTSPEFAMKRLLAAGSGSIYQICPAFRSGDVGRKHNPEFTLLEWYRVGFDYQKLMQEVEQLIGCLIGNRPEFRRVRYHDLFSHYLDLDISRLNLDEMRMHTRQRIPGTETGSFSFNDCLNLLLSICIEPQMKGFEFVYDYPASQASLARINPHKPEVAERFELFFDGMELANGFSELTDATIQRQRFIADNNQRKMNGQAEIPVDEAFLAALDAGLPECAGVALGLDRLIMVLAKRDNITEVLSFTDFSS